METAEGASMAHTNLECAGKLSSCRGSMDVKVFNHASN
jgi:hypothetical protein